MVGPIDPLAVLRAVADLLATDAILELFIAGHLDGTASPAMLDLIFQFAVDQIEIAEGQSGIHFRVDSLRVGGLTTPKYGIQ